MYAKAWAGVGMAFLGGVLIHLFEQPLLGTLALLVSSAAFVWSTVDSEPQQLRAGLLIGVVVGGFTLLSSIPGRVLLGGYTLTTGVAIWAIHGVIRPYLQRAKND